MSEAKSSASASVGIDTFIDALWLEEGLSRNTLAAYRRDLTLYAAWLAQQSRTLDTTTEANLNG
ncbi:MAG: site-specific integrase, partial [Ramlibacter sp.]|nr:site-specific integrase [Ramlibacter sp.]